MASPLDRFDTPMRFSIIGFFGGVIGVFILSILKDDPNASWFLTPIATGIGGYVGGLIRRRHGRSN